MKPEFVDRLNVVLVTIALVGLVSGLGLWAVGKPELANYAWIVGVIPILSTRL